MEKKTAAFLQKAGASVLGLGYFPIASGTVGSAAAIAVIVALHHYVPVLFAPESAPLFWLVTVAGVAASMGLSSRAVDNFGSEDPSPIVIDEFVGQWITFLMVPVTWRTLLLGFLLFRFFDIVKPYPVYALEEAEGGVGITMDDVVAGICANICLVGALAAYHAVRAWL